MLGILDRNNPVCNTIKYNEVKWSLPVEYITKFRRNDQLMICDHQITRSKLFGDIFSFKKILNGKAINIVSPNTDMLVKNNISELLEVDVGYTTTTNNRNDILEKIYKIKEPIVIYGTSLTGKDIGARLSRECGKVCIDYGATVEAWGGVAARSWFKDGGIQNYCLVK